MTAGEDGDDAVVDPGLQSERTRLAWDRTALSFSTFGALLVHAGHSRASPPALVFGIAVICSGFAIYVLGRRRYRRLVASLRDGGAAPRPRALAVVGALAIVTTVLSGLEAVLPH
jgi:uncharacterized membrane protein YidH (DUF202 family)